MPDLNQRGLNSQTILRETIVPRIDITTSDGATVEVQKVPLKTGDSVVEITVQGVSATEESPGQVQEATEQQVQDGTAQSDAGVRLFVNPAKLAAWWGWVKGQVQTITEAWAFADVKLINQAATEDTHRLLIVDDVGKIIKEESASYNPSTKELTLTAGNTLDTSFTFVLLDSNGQLIARFRNDKVLEIGGSTFVLEVDDSVTNGNAQIRFNAGQSAAFDLRDKDENRYISFDSTEDNKNVRISQKVIKDQEIGVTEVETQIQVRVPASTNEATTIYSIPLGLNEIGSVFVSHFLARSVVGNVAYSAHGFGGFVRSSAGTLSSIGSSVTDFNNGTSATLTLVANDTDKTIDVVFTNDTSTGLVFDLSMSFSYITRLIPEN